MKGYLENFDADTEGESYALLLALALLALIDRAQMLHGCAEKFTQMRVEDFALTHQRPIEAVGILRRRVKGAQTFADAIGTTCEEITQGIRDLEIAVMDAADDDLRDAFLNHPGIRGGADLCDVAGHQARRSQMARQKLLNRVWAAEERLSEIRAAEAAAAAEEAEDAAEEAAETVRRREEDARDAAGILDHNLLRIPEAGVLLSLPTWEE